MSKPVAWMAFDPAYQRRRIAWNEQEKADAGGGLEWEPLFTHPEGGRITDCWQGESGTVYVSHDGGKTGREFDGFNAFAKWLVERHTSQVER